MGKELPADYYDDVFATSKAYSVDPENSGYLHCWKVSIELLFSHNPINVIDLGCGPGQFAQLLSRDPRANTINYLGLDFSSVAISKAQDKRLLPNFKFKQIDLAGVGAEIERELPDTKNICYVSTEFLEHVEWDLDLLARLPQDRPFAGSVPKYDSAGHVRFFTTPAQVHERYSKVMRISKLGETAGGMYVFTGLLGV